jgi:outer membrane protein assembly factor BamD (BamD/ComL family)
VEGKSDSLETSSSLEEEVTRIDRARLALSSGSAARALGELDDYDAKFPAGMMKPEATAVRIEAMVQNGNLAGAKVLGRRFLSAHPSGGLSVRVHKVIGE